MEFGWSTIVCDSTATMSSLLKRLQRERERERGRPESLVMREQVNSSFRAQGALNAVPSNLRVLGLPFRGKVIGN